jgi:cytochrome c oxidase subunit 2
MPKADYEKWLAHSDAGETLATAGKTLFMRYGCSGCHGANGVGGSQSQSTVRAPSLAGLYGSPVTLADGSVIKADERYIRDCILTPASRRVAGYLPVMPSFAGEISEEDLLRIIAYLESLTSRESS